ncbi:MAG: TRAP transporter small permease [Paenibacillaceae bacterium]
MKESNLFNRILSSFEITISGVFLVLACSLVFTSVLLRETVGFSTSVIEEIVRYLIVWSVFIGSSWALKSGKHISIDILTKNLPARFRMILLTFSFVLGFCFSVILCYEGAIIVTHSYAIGERSVSVWSFPMYIPKLVIPIGAILIAIRFAEQIYLQLFRPSEGEIS